MLGEKAHLLPTVTHAVAKRLAKCFVSGSALVELAHDDSLAEFYGRAASELDIDLNTC